MIKLLLESHEINLASTIVRATRVELSYMKRRLQILVVRDFEGWAQVGWYWSSSRIVECGETKRCVLEWRSRRGLWGGERKTSRRGGQDLTQDIDKSFLYPGGPMKSCFLGLMSPWVLLCCLCRFVSLPVGLLPKQESVACEQRWIDADSRTVLAIPGAVHHRRLSAA